MPFSLIRNAVISMVSLTLACNAAQAQMPQMGGPMEHILVHLHSGNMLEAHVHNPGPLMLRSYGETYTGAAAALTGTFYNAQYGWMVEGFWTPPEGSFLWIRCTYASPGLMSLSGGTMMNQGSFAPIFGAEGSDDKITWNGAMLHNWYAAATPGTFAASYTVYFGDAAGVPTAGYEASTATLSWKTGLACLGDFDGSGTVSVQDIFTYLSAYFAGDLAADIDHAGSVSVQDIFAFLASYFGVC